MKRNPFKSKADGLNRRKPCWICLDCGSWHEKKPAKQATCNECKGKAQYFASRAEAKRFMDLTMQQQHGLIERLSVQPRFDVVINGSKVTQYRADFEYVRDGERVIEDVKGNAGSITDVFLLKKRLVEAVFGIDINIVRVT